MFFILSKIFWAVFTPLTAILIVITISGLAYKYNWGRKLLQFGVILFALLGFLPIGHNALVYLENIYAGSTLPQKVDGIILLGGVIDIETSKARNQVQLYNNAGRITELIALSHTYPQAKIVISGGNGMLRDVGTNEGEQTSILFKKLHINQDRMIYETKSRNTYENMLFSREVINPQAGENWLLITSAYHMPRSVAIFVSNDWLVTPIPAGYITDGKYTFMPTLDVLGGYYKLHIALKEMIGIIAYTLSGKIK